MDIERLKELTQSEDSDLWDYKEELIALIDAEIARQSATSEEVQRAINVLATTSEGHDVFAFYKSDKVKRAIDLAITALLAYQPTSSKTEKVEPCRYCIGMESHRIATVKTVMDEYGCELGYDAPYNYCPNCGRKIKEEQP